MRKCLTLLSLFFLISVCSIAQERALFSWKHYPSFQNIRQITGTQSLVFAASDFGLYSLRQDQSVNRINTEDGLSGADFGVIEYLVDQQTLLIGYRSGVIDLVFPSEVKSDASLSSLDSRLSKKMNDIALIGNTAYLASDLGVVEFQISQAKVRDIFRNIAPDAEPVVCFSIETDGEYLYAFTDYGLFKGAVSNNLLDFSQWIQLNSYPFDEQTSSAYTGNSLYFSIGDRQLIQMNQEGALLDSIDCFQPIHSLKVFENVLYGSAGNLLFQEVSGQINILETSSQDILDFHIQNNQTWISIAENGIYSLENKVSIVPSGPTQDIPLTIQSFADTGYFLFNDGPGSQFNSGTWQTLPDEIIAVLSYQNSHWRATTANTLISNDGQTEIVIPAINGQVTGGIEFDNEIWITLKNSNTPLLKSSDLDNWTSYSSSFFGTQSLHRPKVSQGGTLYFLDDRNNLLAFNSFDEEVRLLGGSAGLSGQINDYRIDLKDALYIATDDGLFYAPDATFIFNSDRIDEAFIGGGDLLSGDRYTSISIDPGNRKWLATDKGLWHYNETLSEQIKFYSASNSPLVSNAIHKLHFQNKTGVLWIATDYGLNSLQTDAIIPQLFHQDVTIFPNPVSLKSGIDQVGISGLYQNAILKISTLSGRYVSEVRANGSLASWNLKSSDGQVVTPGIYLFFSTDENGNDTFVGKILVEP